MSATRTTRRCTTTWRRPARIGRGSAAGDRRSARESASRPTTPATSRGGARRGRAAPATGWARARRRRVFLACDHDGPFTWRASRRRAPAGALAYIACRFSARAIVCIAVSVHSNRVLARRRARAGACGPVRACQRVRACVRACASVHVWPYPASRRTLRCTHARKGSASLLLPPQIYFSWLA